MKVVGEAGTAHIAGEYDDTHETPEEHGPCATGDAVAEDHEDVGERRQEKVHQYAFATT